MLPSRPSSTRIAQSSHFFKHEEFHTSFQSSLLSLRFSFRGVRCRRCCWWPWVGVKGCLLIPSCFSLSLLISTCDATAEEEEEWDCCSPVDEIQVWWMDGEIIWEYERRDVVSWYGCCCRNKSYWIYWRISWEHWGKNELTVGKLYCFPCIYFHPSTLYHHAMHFYINLNRKEQPRMDGQTCGHHKHSPSPSTKSIIHMDLFHLFPTSSGRAHYSTIFFHACSITYDDAVCVVC